MTQKKNTKKKVRITTYKNPEIYEILDKNRWSDELTTPKEKKVLKKLGYSGEKR